MDKIIQILGKIPDIVKLIEEVRGLVQDLKDVYQLKIEQGAQNVASSTQDTSQLENSLKPAAPGT